MSCSPLNLRSIGFVAAVTLFGAATPAFAAITINPATDVLLGIEPSGVAFGDFDNDGDMDIATTVDGPDRIAIALNNGAGAFLPGPSTILPVSSSPQDVVAGDFNGDGLMDLAVAVRDPGGAVLIMSGNGVGSFGLAQTVSVGARPRGLDMADFDGDGDLDLAVANRDGNSAHVMTNVGGSFTAVQLPTGVEPRATAFGDFDADGDMDLAVTNHDSNSVSIYTNVGGAFSASATLPVLGSPEGVDAMDLDGDGDADLAVTGGPGGAGQVSVYLSAGATFGPAAIFPTGGFDSSQLAFADFDCDSLVDIVVTNSDSASISVLPATGMGTYGTPMILAAGPNPSEISVADYDGDGAPDIAVANGDGSSVSVYENGGDCDGTPPPAPCPADITGDGNVAFEDLLEVLGAWGACPKG
ncbi:MAG: FG-GAP repeat domain-containing protein [Phycisphaerales bacterium]